MEDGGPAFPSVRETDNAFVPGRPVHTSGMSLRDWFAGMALEGHLSSPSEAEEPVFRTWGGFETRETLARRCYEAADAMLKEREK